MEPRYPNANDFIENLRGNYNNSYEDDETNSTNVITPDLLNSIIGKLQEGSEKEESSDDNTMDVEPIGNAEIEGNNDNEVSINAVKDTALENLHDINEVGKDSVDNGTPMLEKEQANHGPAKVPNASKFASLMAKKVGKVWIRTTKTSIEIKEELAISCLNGDFEALKSTLNAPGTDDIINRHKANMRFKLYPLHRACEDGDLERVGKWIDQGCIDTKDHDGHTPLMVAIEYGKKKIVEHLIDKKANLYIRNHDMKNCLHIAVESYNTESRMPMGKILKKLVKRCANWIINSGDTKQRTPLHYAAENGNREALEYLLEKSPYMKDDNEGLSPLHLAVQEEKVDCVALIVNHSWYSLSIEDIINRKDTDKRTALKIAAEKNNPEICKLLLDKGAKVRDLLSAETKHFVEICEYLMSTYVPGDHDECEGSTKLLDFRTVQEEVDCLKSLVPILDDEEKNIALGNKKEEETELATEELKGEKKENNKGSNMYKIAHQLKKQIFHVLLKEDNRSETVLVIPLINASQDKKGEQYREMMNEINGNKVVKLLKKDMQDEKGIQNKVMMEEIIKKAPEVARYLLDKSWKEVTKKDDESISNKSSIRQNGTKEESSINIKEYEEIVTKDKAKKESKDELPSGTTIYDFSLLDARHPEVSKKKKTKEEKLKEKEEKPFFAPITMKRYKPDLLKHPLTKRLLKSKWGRLGLPWSAFGFSCYVLFLALLTTTVVLEKKNEQLFAMGGKLNVAQYYKSLNALDANTVRMVNISVDPANYCKSQHVHKMKKVNIPMNMTYICQKNTTKAHAKFLEEVNVQLAKLRHNGTQHCKLLPKHNPKQDKKDVKSPWKVVTKYCNASFTMRQVLTLSWIILFMSLFLLVKEFLRFRYTMTMSLCIREPLTVFEVFTYLASLVFLGPFLVVTDIITLEVHWVFKWKWESASIAILAGWVTLLHYMKSIPRIGIYIWMFEAVTQTVIKVVISLFFLILAFAASWYVMLSKTQLQFKLFGHSVMKTVRMTFGELEFEKMFVDGKLEYMDLTYFIYLLFLMVMPILFMNVLVGLAVGDIEAVKVSAYNRHITNRVSALANFNETFPNSLLINLHRKGEVDLPKSWWQRLKHRMMSIESQQEEDDSRQKFVRSKNLRHKKSFFQTLKRKSKTITRGRRPALRRTRGDAIRLNETNDHIV